MKKLIIIGMVVLFGTSVSFAGRTNHCTRTTKKCGTKLRKPLDGYGGQREACNKKNEKPRCGGCGKNVSKK